MGERPVERLALLAFFRFPCSLKHQEQCTHRSFLLRPPVGQMVEAWKHNPTNSGTAFSPPLSTDNWIVPSYAMGAVPIFQLTSLQRFEFFLNLHFLCSCNTLTRQHCILHTCILLLALSVVFVYGLTVLKCYDLIGEHASKAVHSILVMRQ